MYKFNFYYNTLEGKRCHKTIKASNKQDAIKKAFDFIKKNNIAINPHWEISLASTF